MIENLNGNSKYRETVQLPLEKDSFVHIETSHDQLARSFAEYAEKLGFDSDKAREFFENRIIFTFGKSKYSTYPSQFTPFDKAVNRLLTDMDKDLYFACIAYTKTNNYEFVLNTPLIQKHLPKFKIRQVWQVENYEVQTVEQKMATLEQSINSITYHEFYHIIQFMNEPEMMEQAMQNAVYAQRLICTWAIANFAASQVIPEYVVYAAATSLIPTIGSVLYLQRRGKDKMENGAYETQEKAKTIKLAKDPYSFTYEKA